jgi:nitrate reductase alpha subunit
VRPEDYGIDAADEHWDHRTIRNIKMPWADVKETKNFLWEKGFQFYCLTPKTRHRVHSSWSNVDWHMLYDSNFGDPYRLDKRAPSVGEHQLHINPAAARDLGINDGDYVYVDANPADRPYLAAEHRRLGLPPGAEFIRLRSTTEDDVPMACGSCSLLANGPPGAGEP